MLPEPIKYIVIAHGGPDGICAASIAVSKLEDPIDLYFSQSYTIKVLIKKLLRTEQHDKVRIYILDIHINKSVIELLQKFNKVVYIDHHQHSVKHKGIFPGNIDQYKSSSQLASEYFSALKTPLATLGTIADKMLSVSPNDPMLQEITILQKAIVCKFDDDDFRRNCVEQLSSGLMPSQITAIKERVKRSEYTLNRLIKQATSNLVETKNCAITFTDENAKGFGRQIVNNLISDQDYPIFLLYPDKERDKIVILARNSSQKNNIDLSEFMSNYFNGGGHPNAAGGAIEGIHNPGVNMVKDNLEEYMDGM